MPKKKLSINWLEVERIMLKSFRGHGMTEDEEKLITLAFKKHPIIYHRTHMKMKIGEVKRIRMGG